jgi:choline kinase
MINIIILGDKYQKGKKSKGCPGLIIEKNKRIIDGQLNSIKNVFDKSKIYYVSGYESDKISQHIIKKQYDINIINNNNYHEYNESYSLSLALSQINNNPLLIISGYYTPSVSLLNTINIDRSMVFIDKNNKTKLGCIVNDNIVENIFFDLDNYIQDIVFIESKTVSSIKKLLSNKKYMNCFIFEIINSLIDIGHTFYTKNLSTKEYKKIYEKKKNSIIQ